jgi:hypothetical protein
MINIIKSTFINYNSPTLVSTYFPDSNKKVSKFQEFLDTFSNQIRSIDHHSFLVTGADTNASLEIADTKTNHLSQERKEHMVQVQGPHGNTL